MPDPYFVSVVVPTRDRPELLRVALNSIRALEGDDVRLEVIVSDNSGCGSARALAREFGARYVTAAKPGPSAARNAGFRAATGDYIVFLDDDDVFLPGHLRPHLRMLDEHPSYAAVFGQTQLTDACLQPTGQPYPTAPGDPDDRYDEFFRQHPQMGVTVSRMSVRDSVGFFNEDVTSCEDWEWNLRLAAAHAIGFVAVPCILFRQRPIGTHDELQWERLHIDTRAILKQYRASSRRPALLTAARVLFRSRGHFSWYFLESSYAHAREGDHAEQRRAFYRAFRASPLHATINLARRGALGHIVSSL